jgi:hypothetical protein
MTLCFAGCSILHKGDRISDSSLLSTNTNGTIPKHESTTKGYIMKMFLYRQL